MGKLTRQRYAELDALIADRGEDWMLEQITDGISEGLSHADLACRLGLKWGIVRQWIEANCAEDVAGAYRARADLMMDQATKSAMQADVDSLAVDKFQAEFWLKLAGKADRTKYGDRTEVAVTNVHTVDFRGLLEMREARLRELVQSQVVSVQSEAMPVYESMQEGEL